jgi:hypothetical protein
MDTERSMLVWQIAAGVAALDRLASGAAAGAPGDDAPGLARLSTADLEAVVASLASLVQGARRWAPPAGDGHLG